MSVMKTNEVHPTEGDANCCFKAIVYMLTGSEEQHSILRSHVVEHIKINQLDDCIMKNGKTYLEESRMTDSGVWATDAELLACAAFIGCDIIVYAKMGAFSEWLRYPASLSLSDPSPNCLLMVNKGNHFEAVTSLK